MFKKMFAEFIGTAVLVMLGCGTAMLVGCDAFVGSGYLLTALAFGLVIVAMAYSIGNVSGCHINPAVSFAMLLSKRMSFKDFLGYVIAQVLGACVGTGMLVLLVKSGAVGDMTGGFGSNGLTGVNGVWYAGLGVEIVLTFVFVLTILGVTSKKEGHDHFAGLIIGLSLVLVHILGIGLTGTSVNPARSIGPALAAMWWGNAAPINCLWIFVAGPMIGAALAALAYRIMAGKNA